MKKLKNYLLVAALATLTTFAFAQGDSIGPVDTATEVVAGDTGVGDTGVVTDPITHDLETGGNPDPLSPLAVYFLSLTTLAAGVTIVTGWATTHNKLALSIGKQNMSWIIGIGAGALGHYLDIGAFGQLSWYWSLANGFLAGQISNSNANIEWVKVVLRAIAAKAKL